MIMRRGWHTGPRLSNVQINIWLSSSDAVPPNGNVAISIFCTRLPASSLPPQTFRWNSTRHTLTNSSRPLAGAYQLGWNVLPLSPASTCIRAHLLSCPPTFIPISLRGRIPNWALALPYPEAGTKLIWITAIRRWSCPTCCQMDRPWDACCKWTNTKCVPSK